MKNKHISILPLALLLGMAAPALHAQPLPTPEPHNVLQLSTSATVEAAQDQITMRLGTTRDGAQAQAVQDQLKAAVEQALATLRPLAKEDAMSVHSGDFQVQPRYGREGQIQGWQGRAELILEGRDIPRVAQAVASVTSLAVTGVNFSLSPPRLRQAQASAEQQAIRRFREKAGELARGFGFSGYSLREVSVQGGEQELPRPRMLAMEARAASAPSPVPVEPGRTTVLVTVSGSVQMQGAGRADAGK